MSLIRGKSDFEKVKNYLQTASRLFDFTEVSKDSFRPSSLINGRNSQSVAVFGGVICAQALAAAEKTVEKRLRSHSMHSHFVWGVDPKEPILYNVRRVRDGKAFATRTVDAIQKGSVCFVLQCSFHVGEHDSIVHQADMPKVPAPESLPSMRKVVPYLKDLVEAGELTVTPAMMWRLATYDSKIYSDENDLFEMRCTNLGNYYGFASDRKPELYFWMRARGDLSGEDRLHRWLLTYISDAIPTAATFSPHYSQGFHPKLALSLDHSVWFHRPEDVRADEWLLFECKSRVASGSRTLIEGRIWRRDGVLMASCQQEALLRRSANDAVSKI